MSRTNPTIAEKERKQHRYLGVRKFRWARKCKTCGARTYIGTKENECKACVLAAMPTPPDLHNHAALEDAGCYLPTPEEIAVAMDKFRAAKLERLRIEEPENVD